MVGILADCLVLGWQDWPIDLAQRIYRGLDRQDLFVDADASSHPRTQAFVLRLLANWQ